MPGEWEEQPGYQHLWKKGTEKEEAKRRNRGLWVITPFNTMPFNTAYTVLLCGAFQYSLHKHLNMALTPNKILFYLLVLFKIRPTPVPSSKHYILMTTNVG